MSSNNRNRKPAGGRLSALPDAGAVQVALDAGAVQVALDALGEGVIIADRDGRFVSFNPMAERILGTGLRDVSPAEWTAVYGCFQSDQVTPYPADQLPLARAIRGEATMDELIFVRNPGQPAGVWISVSGSPVVDADGQVSGGVAILRDITVRQEAIKKAMQLAMAVEQTADSIIITDRAGVIEYVNPAFEITTGYSRAEALGHTPRILKSGRQGREFYQRMWNRILAGHSFRATLLNRKKGGDLFWAEQTITPLRDMADTITNFVSVLKDVTELRKKQEQDLQLEVARQVQQSLYPEPVFVPGFDIAGQAHLADETGGDYYDYIATADGYLWIVVGDVSGHGIGSALTMAETRAYMRACAKLGLEPGELLGRVNQELSADSGRDRFVPTITVCLDHGQSSLVYANAGHTPGYLLNGSGEVVAEMKNTGIPLGSLPDYQYTTGERIALSPGDILFLSTDGITEARNRKNSEFGIERALEVVRQHRRAGAQEIVEQLYQAARSFSAGRPQEDDITVVICKVHAA